MALKRKITNAQQQPSAKRVRVDKNIPTGTLYVDPALLAKAKSKYAAKKNAAPKAQVVATEAKQPAPSTVAQAPAAVKQPEAPAPTKKKVSLSQYLAGQRAQRKRATQGNVWTELYRPIRSAELIGNVKAVTQLRAWISDSKEAQKKEEPPDKQVPRVALLSGPPGVGKTTAAHVLLTEAGYEVHEVNASDVRSATKLIATTQRVCGTRMGNVWRALVLDEFDGAMDGEQGAAAALLKFVKSYTGKLTPIVCVANDRSSQALRSLAAYAQDIRFWPLYDSDLQKLLYAICNVRKISLNMTQKYSILQSARGDARQLLLNLQLASLHTGECESARDRSDNIFVVGTNMLFNTQVDLTDLTRAYEAEPFMNGVIYEDNYLRCLNSSAHDSAALKTRAQDVPPNQRAMYAGIVHKHTHTLEHMASLADMVSLTSETLHTAAKIHHTAVAPVRALAARVHGEPKQQYKSTTMDLPGTHKKAVSFGTGLSAASTIRAARARDVATRQTHGLGDPQDMAMYRLLVRTHLARIDALETQTPKTKEFGEQMKTALVEALSTIRRAGLDVAAVEKLACVDLHAKKSRSYKWTSLKRLMVQDQQEKESQTSVRKTRVVHKGRGKSRKCVLKSTGKM